jgi:NTE family protein
LSAAPSSPLDSPGVGTGLVVKPCGDSLRPAQPSPHPVGPTFGLTFSGGGFRATFAALGIVRYLADAGLLDRVRYVSSVSGGSIANGLLAVHWPKLREAHHSSEAVDRLLIDPTVARVSKHSLKRSLLVNAWRTIGSRNRTDLLGDRMDKWFFHKTRLDALDPEVRWIFNAANITTGVRFGFERDVVGDYVVGLLPAAGTGLRVAQAAAASAAVPGAFAAWELQGLKFPCAQESPKLLDRSSPG